MNKLISLSLVACALISNNNSFGMLRTLTRISTPLRTPAKFIRTIAYHLTSEQRTRLLAASETLNERIMTNQQCSLALRTLPFEEAITLLKAHTSLSAFIKNRNAENYAVLKRENSDGMYNIHNLHSHLMLLDYLETQLTVKE